MTTYARVDRVWTGRTWLDDGLVAIGDEWIRPVAGSSGSVHRLAGTLLPPLTDAHVHLGLSDFAERGGGALARVLDLGWDPAALSTVVAEAGRSWPGTEVAFVGPFLTAPGGYPRSRPWAPQGAVIEVAGPEQVMAAVHQVRALGAAMVKVALNADAGPVLPDQVLTSLVESAHAVELLVVAHVQGGAQAQRARLAGVDALAHTPWTERLSDAELTAMAEQMTWISTLDMHGRGRYGDDYATALDNLTRFAAAGGTVVYGTDLGNDATLTNLNLREIAGLRMAGVSGERLLGAMTAAGLLRPWSKTVTLVPEVLSGPEEAVEALLTSRPLDAFALKELLR